MKLSIVVPVYNSAGILPKLAARIAAALKGIVDSYELILVDDCSPDGSWAVVQSLGKVDPSVRGVRLRRNAGQHNAVMAGLNHATGEVIVVMDDDLQHAPEDIPLLYAKVAGGHDVCFARFKEMRHAWWKRAGSAFNDMVARVLLKKPRDVYLSPFKAFSRAVCSEVIRYTGPYAYLDGLILRTTSNLVCVDVAHHERAGGRSNYTFLKSLKLWTMMATSFSVLPLRVAGLLGIAMAFFGFGLATVAIALRLRGGVEIPLGWTSLIVVVLIIGGVQLLALGLIGEYLGRAYLRLNNAPQFSVAEKVNI